MDGKVPVSEAITLAYIATIKALSIDTSPSSSIRRCSIKVFVSHGGMQGRMTSAE